MVTKSDFSEGRREVIYGLVEQGPVHDVAVLHRQRKQWLLVEFPDFSSKECHNLELAVYFTLEVDCLQAGRKRVQGMAEGCSKGQMKQGRREIDQRLVELLAKVEVDERSRKRRERLVEDISKSKMSKGWRKREDHLIELLSKGKASQGWREGCRQSLVEAISKGESGD